MDCSKENRNLSLPVLTSVLERRAAEEITELDIARFRAKWSASAARVKLSTRKSSQMAYMAKMLSVAASVAIVFLGVVAFFGQAQYQYMVERSDAVYGGATESRIAHAAGSDSAAALLASQLNAIRFTGGACDCGHENPSGAYIEGDTEALMGRNITYEIRVQGSDMPVSTGEGQDVSAAFAELKNAHSSGQYTLFFYLGEGNYHIVTMTRNFEIS